LLTIGGNPGLRLPHELPGPHRPTQAPGNAARAPTMLAPGLFRSVAPSIERGIAFQVHSLVAQQSEHATPPLRRDVVLAVYQAHLAERVRYYGPLTPVDLRI
jgi:hypothetical protein